MEHSTARTIALPFIGSTNIPNPPTFMIGSVVFASGLATSSPSPVSATLFLPFTTDSALASQRLYDLSPFGDGRFYDGVFAGLQTLGTAHYPNRTLILITNGVGDATLEPSHVKTKHDTLGELHESRWQIYSVLITDAVSDSSLHPIGEATRNRLTEINSKLLQELLSASGWGGSYKARSSAVDGGKSLTDAISKIGAQLGHTYIIGIVAPQTGWDAIRPFSVKVLSHPDANVHVQRLPASQT